MGIGARRNGRDCACVIDPAYVGVNPSVQVRRSAKHEHPQKSCSNESGDERTCRNAAFHRQRVCVGRAQTATTF